jgi:hypothetical protein
LFYAHIMLKRLTRFVRHLPFFAAIVMLLIEIAALDLMYWAGSANLTTVTEDEFFLVPVAAAIAVGWVLSRRFGKVVSYVSGVVLSFIAFGVAMLIGLNTWGS